MAALNGRFFSGNLLGIRYPMKTLVGQHILSSEQFDLEILSKLFHTADILKPVAQGKAHTHVLEGAVMGSLFFEASTRTRLSFDAAFMRLGGKVSSTTGVSFSSIVKGESIEDTSRVISGYFDVMVVRHPEEEAIYKMASATNVPLINGGNGAGEHPTQALLDAYTIYSEFKQLNKSIDGARITMLGDLRYGRTVHSLVKLLSLYNNLTFVFVSPDFLSMPENITEFARSRGHKIIVTDQLAEGIQGSDIIYATRIQKERFIDGEEGKTSQLNFRVNQALINQYALKDTIILHPLPRDSRENANDLSNDLDTDSRLAIFRQSDAGVPARMALFAMVLGVDKDIENHIKPAHWFVPNA